MTDNSVLRVEQLSQLNETGTLVKQELLIP